MIVLAFSATESLDAAACLMYKAVTSSKISLDMVPSTDSVNNFLKFAPSMMHVGDGV